MDLHLDQAIESVVGHFQTPELRRAVQDLSRRYRDTGSSRSSLVTSEIDAAAYAAYRMPATYSALSAIMDQVRLRLPGWTPSSMLDVGAGTGAGLWAAAPHWPGIESYTLLDSDQRMLDLGRRLWERSVSDNVTSIAWSSGRLGSASELPNSDLVLTSYVLNETSPSEREQSIQQLWAATSSVLIIVEPGTPAGFEIIRWARRKLIDLGSRIIAPCPHGAECPMTDGDWCHFSTRLARSRLHRSVKPGELGYEDEKFSYVVASRGIGEPADSRILRHPIYRRKMIELTLCTRDGLQKAKLTRGKHGELYRQARHSSWGDEYPDP